MIENVFQLYGTVFFVLLINFLFVSYLVPPKAVDACNNFNLIPSFTFADVFHAGKSAILSDEDSSDCFQSRFAFSLNGEMRNGFFIEVGAHNGIFQSNTKWLEANQDWNGILIEPDPFNFEKLKNARNVFKMNVCLTKCAEVVSDKLMRFHEGAYSWTSGNRGRGLPSVLNILSHGTIPLGQKTVKCVPVSAIGRLFNLTAVDLFAIDIEGNEPNILSTMETWPFTVGVFVIEVRSVTEPLVHRAMEKHGYRKAASLGKDVVYVHRKNAQYMAKACRELERISASSSKCTIECSSY